MDFSSVFEVTGKLLFFGSNVTKTLVTRGAACGPRSRRVLCIPQNALGDPQLGMLAQLFVRAELHIPYLFNREGCGLRLPSLFMAEEACRVAGEALAVSQRGRAASRAGNWCHVARTCSANYAPGKLLSTAGDTVKRLPDAGVVWSFGYQIAKSHIPRTGVERASCLCDLPRSASAGSFPAGACGRWHTGRLCLRARSLLRLATRSRAASAVRSTTVTKEPRWTASTRLRRFRCALAEPHPGRGARSRRSGTGPRPTGTRLGTACRDFCRRGKE